MGWLLGPPAGRRVALTTAAVVAATIAGSRAIVAIMHAQHVVGTHFDIHFAAFDRIETNVRMLLESIAFFFNGDLSGTPFTLEFTGVPLNGRGVLTVACAVVVGAALVVVLGLGRAWWRTHAAPPAGVPGPAPAGSPEAARRAHVTFWLVTAPLLSLGYVFTSVPNGVFTSRYLLAVGYALAALVPVVAVARGTWGRALVVVGLCVVVAGSVRGLAARELQANPDPMPDGSVSGPLLRLAQAEQVRYGYAGYWDALPISWQTKEKLQLYSVKPCSGDRLCPGDAHQISSWYVPRPGIRTMLVLDQVPFAGHPRQAPPSLGPAQRVAKIRQLTIYIYPYDIASRFGER
jgi:hypothetical protein